MFEEDIILEVALRKESVDRNFMAQNLKA